MGLIKHLMRLLHGSDAFTRDLLEAWAYGVPVNEVLQTSTV
jgi:hypothetical protein